METVMHQVTDARTPDGRTSGRRWPRLAITLGIVLVAAYGAGALSSFGQAVEAFSSLSNSAGPWFLVAGGLASVVRVRIGWSMPLGVVLLLLMHVGYTETTILRGYPDFLSITSPWVLLAFPAGLLAGACAAAVRGLGRSSVVRERWRAVAVGTTVAVLAGEGIRALLTVADTTGTVFWTVEIVTAALLAAVGTALVVRSKWARVLLLGTAVVGTAAVLGAYSSLLGG